MKKSVSIDNTYGKRTTLTNFAEQPFGYDRNDLDLDFFCRELIHVEIEDLRRTQAPNSYLALPNAIKATDIYGRGAVVDAATVEAEEEVKTFDPAHPLNSVPSTSSY